MTYIPCPQKITIKNGKAIFEENVENQYITFRENSTSLWHIIKFNVK